MPNTDVNTRYRVWCKKCGREMVPTEVRTVVDKGIVDKILMETLFGIGIYRCTEGHRVFLLRDIEPGELPIE